MACPFFCLFCFHLRINHIADQSSQVVRLFFFSFLCFDCEVFKYKTTCFLSVSKGKRVAWARSGGCVLFLGVNRSTFFSL